MARTLPPDSRIHVLARANGALAALADFRDLPDWKQARLLFRQAWAILPIAPLPSGPLTPAPNPSRRTQPMSLNLLKTLRHAEEQAAHEVHTVLGGLFAGNVKVWVANEVTLVLRARGGATLAQVEAAVDAALPALIGHLTPFLPDVLRPFEGEIAPYATALVNSLVEHEYARLAQAAATQTAAALDAAFPTLPAAAPTLPAAVPTLPTGDPAGGK